MKNEAKPVPVEPSTHHVMLPRWLVKKEIGLGHLVTRVTSRAGIQACAGCEKRAAALDRWMKFSPR
jgi:hypothetical protein